MRERIRIEASDVVGHHTKVVHVRTVQLPNRELVDIETDISATLTGVDLSIKVGELNVATLHALCVEGQLDAALERIIVRHHRRPLLWRLRKVWWRLRRPRRSDVTLLGGSRRRYT